MTLDEAKIFLRVDENYDDDRILALMAGAKAYIAESTGLSQDLQDAEPLCKVAMEFCLRHWYEPTNEITFYTERALESILKAIKAKYSVGVSNANQSADGA